MDSIFLPAGSDNSEIAKEASLNLAINSINFFFQYVYKNSIIMETRRPRQDKKLPVVLSSKEIINILNMEINPKHRLLFCIKKPDFSLFCNNNLHIIQALWGQRG